MTFNITHAPVLAVTTNIENPPAVAGWKIAPVEAINVGATVYVIGLSSFDQASTDDAEIAVSGAVSTHNASASAHAAINSRFDLAGAATAAVATHAADSGAHRNYARIFMMGA